MRRRLAVPLLAVSLAAAVPGAAVAVAPPQPGTTYRADLGLGGLEADGDASRADLSGDGRYLVYHSRARNLIPGDGNGGTDVFRSDLVDPARPKTVRVSVDTLGGDPNGSSTLPSVNNDGRYVAFQSSASDLVGGDTNGVNDVFLRDMLGGTSRVSIGLTGGPANGFSTRPSISGNGRYVAFNSTASNLVAGDRNRGTDVFVRDRVARTTVRVTTSSGGDPNGSSLRPVISGDGGYVVFVSSARNLDPRAADGRQHVFRWHRLTRAVELVDVSVNGKAANGGATRPALDATGRRVVFQSAASNLVGGDTNGNEDVFVRDMAAPSGNGMGRVSLSYLGAQLGGASTRGMLSADGNLVAFVTGDHTVLRNDRNGQRDVVVRNLTTRVNHDVSVATDGTTDGSATGCAAGAGPAARPGATDVSTRPVISSDGRRVAFVSSFCNIAGAPADRNGVDDVFLRVYAAPL